MKCILLLLSLILLTSCKYSPVVEDYNYLENNSLRFIKTNEDVSILINKDDKYYLLLLEEDNIDIEVDYLIKYKDINTSIKAKKEYLLNKNILIDDLYFKINDKIEIIINNNDFCIYLKELDKNNYSSCDFLYLYNPDDNFYITINNNLKVLFTNSHTKFNYQFMLHLADVWIDSATVDSSSYTTVTINEENFEISSFEIRGKTIHKKEKS
ncbi:MAG: hypothetical protein ACI31S_06565 [Bacilli bacterium]